MRQSKRSVGALTASAPGLLRTSTIAAISRHRWQLPGRRRGRRPYPRPEQLFEGQVFLNVAVYFDVAVTTMVWLACPRSDQDMNAYDRFPMVWLEAPIVWVEF
jgi:hypothetical protein